MGRFCNSPRVRPDRQNVAKSRGVRIDRACCDSIAPDIRALFSFLWPRPALVLYTAPGISGDLKDDACPKSHLSSQSEDSGASYEPAGSPRMAVRAILSFLGWSGDEIDLSTLFANALQTNVRLHALHIEVKGVLHSRVQVLTIRCYQQLEDVDMRAVQ